jgi:hypothetical protein
MRTAHFLLLTSALVLNSSAFGAESHELMMCNTYSGGGGVSVKGRTLKCEGEPDARGYSKFWTASLMDLYGQGWRVESMSAYPASSSGEATVIFLLNRTTTSDPASPAQK